MDWEWATETEPRSYGMWTRAELDEMVDRQVVEHLMDGQRRPNKGQPRKGGAPLPEARKMAKMYREGAGIKQLAKGFHRSQGTVLETLKEMGVIIRNPHNRRRD